MKENQDNFYKKLGWAVKSVRTRKGVSVLEIAEELEISPQQIYKYESGKNRIPIDTLTKICTLLKVKSEWLIEWSKGKDF